MRSGAPGCVSAAVEVEKIAPGGELTAPRMPFGWTAAEGDPLDVDQAPQAPQQGWIEPRAEPAQRREVRTADHGVDAGPHGHDGELYGP